MLLCGSIAASLIPGVVTIGVAASNPKSSSSSIPDRIVIEDSPSSVDEQISTQSQPAAPTTISDFNWDDMKKSLEAKTFFQAEKNECLACVIPLEPSDQDSAGIEMLQQKLQALQQKLDEIIMQNATFNVNSVGVFSDGSTKKEFVMSEVPSLTMTTQEVKSALNKGDTSTDDVYILGNYIADKKALGEGAFGIVLKGYPKDKEDELVAIKVLKTAEPRLQAAARQEFEMLTKINHKHVIKCVDSFEYNGVFCAVSEFANEGDLRQLIQKQEQTKWKPSEVQDYFTQISYGMAFLHDQKIMHRDLKPANIVVIRLANGDLLLKIADFGLAKEFGGTTQESVSRVGTEVYMSPEMLNRTKYDYANDVWALGCILFELWVFEKLGDIFNENTRKTRLLDISKIAAGGMFTSHKDKAHWTELSNICRKCLDTDTKKRLTCLELSSQMLQLKMKMKAKRSSVSSLMGTNQGFELDYNQWYAFIKDEDLIGVKSFMTIEGFDMSKADWLFGEFRETSLMFAAKNHRKPDILKELLKRDDVDVDGTANHEFTLGNSALILAARNTKSDLIKELLKRPDIYVNKQNFDGLTALMMAAELNAFDNIKELLKHENIDINVRDFEGKTVLDWVNDEGRQELINLLINK